MVVIVGYTQAGQDTTVARRADAGMVRLTGRDVAGLVLCGDMYGAPYDLLAASLAVQPARLRAIVARWRRAGYAATGRLGSARARPGPGWSARTGSRAASTAPSSRSRPRSAGGTPGRWRPGPRPRDACRGCPAGRPARRSAAR